MHRRGFLGLITAGYLIGGCANPQPTQPRRGRVSLGSAARFDMGRHELNLERLVVLRDESGLAVMSLVCTHQECLLRSSAQGYECPCHGSAFSIDGLVRTGPAQRSLEWYGLQIDPHGELVVDFSELVGSDWRLRL